MNKLLKDRVGFIRAMINSVGNLDFVATNEEKLVLADLITQIRQDKNGHFVSVSQEVSSQVSYARIPEYKYDTVKRNRCPLGRYIMRNLDFDKTVIRESVLSKFVQKVWADIESENIKVHVLTGKDIIKAYKSFDGSSAQSCMTGSCCNYVALYALNPDKVSMLVYDEIRSLLWKTDEGVMVFDRCYPSGHGKMEIFRKWAKNQGYVLRANPDRLCDNSVIKLTDNEVYHVTLQHKNVFPYLDTFCYGNLEGKTVVLSNSVDGTDCVFQDQSGSYSSVSNCSCENCDYRMSEDDAYMFFDTCYCEECYHRFVITCTNCGNEELKDDCVESETTGDYYCEDCYNDEFLNCVRCGSETSKEDVTYTYNGDGYCENCAGKKIAQCYICEEMYLKTEGVIVAYEFYCEECAGSHIQECNKCCANVLLDDCVVVEDDHYCEKCAENIDVCDFCTENAFSEKLTNTQEGFKYCEDCFSDNSVECDSCGDFILNENLVFVIKSYNKSVFNCRCCAKKGLTKIS